jgi:hypothetical protein
MNQNQNQQAINRLNLIGETNNITKRINSRKMFKSIKYYSFLDTFCFKKCICNPLKRRFIDIVSKLINQKLSIEYYLESSNNIDILRKIMLNEEQDEKFLNYPHFTLKEQLKEFKIEE